MGGATLCSKNETETMDVPNTMVKRNDDDSMGTGYGELAMQDSSMKGKRLTIKQLKEEKAELVVTIDELKRQ